MPDASANELGQRPLRVLEIGMEWFSAKSAGGLARVYSDLFDLLPPSGVHPFGLVSGPAGVAELTGGRVRNFAVEGDALTSRLRGVRRAIRECLRQQQFDLSSCHFALYAAPGLDLLRRLPMAFHFQGPWADEAAQEDQRGIAITAKRMLERLVYSRADRMIVLSRAFGDLAVRSYGVRPDRVRVVPASIDVARFAVTATRAQACAALGWPADRPILLTVRRLAARMGIDTLLTAMPRIRAGCPDVLLVIVGKGPMAERLRAQAEALGLGDNVHFAGFVADDMLPLAYRAATINVLPTRALEGFGLTAAEALAAGTPSMVTPIGGLPEVVGDLSPDLIFRSVLADDLADGLLAALRGGLKLPDEAACRHYAASRFDPALCGMRTAAVYREIAR
jgi:glycosyltransferase involved in cell wall biosynthesis